MQVKFRTRGRGRPRDPDGTRGPSHAALQKHADSPCFQLHDTSDTLTNAFSDMGRPGRHSHLHTAAGTGDAGPARPVRRGSLQRHARVVRRPRRSGISEPCGRQGTALAAGTPLCRGRWRPRPRHLLAHAAAPPAPGQPDTGVGQQGLGAGGSAALRTECNGATASSLPLLTATSIKPCPVPSSLTLQPVRQYRTVNHDTYEALEHAHEPWTPRPDPHRLMQPPPEPPATEVLHALGCRHGVADTQAYVRGVQVRLGLAFGLSQAQGVVGCLGC